MAYSIPEKIKCIGGINIYITLLRASQLLIQIQLQSVGLLAYYANDSVALNK